MVCGVLLLHAEASSNSITTVLAWFHQSSFLINVVIKRELGSDPQLRSGGDGHHEAPSEVMGIYLPKTH